MKKKHTLFSRYTEHIRAAPKHMQQLHAFLFSGSVTLLLTFGILYFDYGFWHESYSRTTDAVVVAKIKNESESPVQMFSRFFDEAKEKAGTIKSGGDALLEGRQSYSKKEEFLSGTSTKSVE
ncbi:MAG: hypothetical protein KBC21_03260 [Candidatus Pacebacteria bacterium]|nr:hypothetical protein [Candidatus Paceibacterota bacterium]